MSTDWHNTGGVTVVLLLVLGAVASTAGVVVVQSLPGLCPPSL